MLSRLLSTLLSPGTIAHLILYVTERCPLRCKTCFLSYGEKGKGQDLPTDQIKLLAEALRGLVWIDITGGEPFFRDDLPEICGLFDAASVSLPTTGYDPRRIADITSGIRRAVKSELHISVSLDGFEPTNDDIRGKGGYPRAIETIKLLRDIRGVRIKVNTVLCNRNYDEILDFMGFVKTLNVDFHSIIFRRGGREVASAFDCPEPEILEKIKNDIFRMWASYDYSSSFPKRTILRNYQRIMYDTSLNVMRTKKQTPECLAGQRHLVAYANGDLSFCEMLPPFGNLRGTSPDALLSSDHACKVRQDIRGGKCFCHHNCNLLDNFFLNPRHYPALLGIYPVKAGGAK